MCLLHISITTIPHSTCEREHTGLAFLCLVYYTPHSLLQFHPLHCQGQVKNGQVTDIISNPVLLKPLCSWVTLNF